MIKLQTIMRTVWLLRHGERLDYVDSQWLRNTRKFDANCQSDDPPLADKGRRQAKEVADRFVRKNISVDHIFSSPFQRCVETAHILASTINLQIKPEPGICEVLWDFPPGYKTPVDLKSMHPTVDERYEASVVPTSAEQYDSDCYGRVGLAVERILDKFEGDILFVGHGASLSGICVALTGSVGYQGLCTLSKFQQDQATGKWKSIFIGDDSHLSDKTNLRAY